LHNSIAEAQAQHPGQSGFYALIDGIDALASRLAIIESATVSLDVQYYIWHDDMVGKVLHNRLLAAADRGVKVRLLLDDLDTVGKDRLLSLLQYHPNIDVRLFNPLPHRRARWLDFLLSPARINHRMHNKSITADRSVSIMGGRNIGDEYFDAGGDVGFSDLDVIAVGPVTAEISSAFELFWNSKWSFPLQDIVAAKPVTAEDFSQFREQSERYLEQARTGAYAKALTASWDKVYLDLTEEKVTWGRWVFWYDTPEKVLADKVDKENFIAPQLWQAMRDTQQDMAIVSPYFVPGPEVTEFLVNKVKSGVRVQVLTNSLASSDVAMVYAGYSNYRKQLLAGGVELYEFKPLLNADEADRKYSFKGSSRASLHGKYIGFDHRYLFVGSFNLDPRSALLNTELAVVFESPLYAEFLTEAFASKVLQRAYRVELDSQGDLVWTTLEGEQTVTFSVAPETSSWRRFISGLMSVIVPESML